MYIADMDEVVNKDCCSSVSMIGQYALELG